MARAIDADELEMFPYSEGAGTEEQISEWIEQAGLSKDDTASRARDLCWKVIDGFINVVKTQPTLTPPNKPLTMEQLREMKDKPAYLKVFDPLLQSGWHIIKAVTEDKIIFRGWHTVYVPISGMGVDYNLYRRPPEGEDGDATRG